MTLDDLLEMQYTSTGAMKENIVHHFLSLLPNEKKHFCILTTDGEEGRTIDEWQMKGYNQALADIKERIEKEMGT